ncbi:MAG: bifunctional UDP-N-acetylglucosamine diphosphorylase/glucosamine-1-phosphate N-acetyltransferase GlmU [Propionibacteriaceae bacterium]|nr:bifunctional UDP-N-acetylglucosamine diphosphorylase/glucosamine-1-phosphate N-acetyltransferase GlmU [Propionibacteriaceae bacterium]
MSEQVGGIAGVVVLAAGAGTRMKSQTSKLLHQVAGRSMLSYAISAADALTPQNLVVVVGHQREQVEQHLSEIAPHVVTALQENQNGTGDAVRCGLAPLGDLQGEVVVTYGDVPLLTGETLIDLVRAHREHGDAVTLLTAELDDPHGYGRIVRDADGDQVAAIVEQKDCTPEQTEITEINAGIYVFSADVLRAGLASLTTDNAQGELYLTDVVKFARGQGLAVHSMVTADRWQTEGVNDRVQLAAMNREYNRRLIEKAQRAGVTVLDPATTWLHDTVDLGSDVTLLPGTSIEGATSVASGATIGPDTTLIDAEVGEGAKVIRSHVELAVIGAGASVGPFANLRPGTQLAPAVKVGAFVETKNVRVGEGAKLPHHVYAGDATIGARTTIGAGVVFDNNDGFAKQSATVGADAFVGAQSVLVAPVELADGAHVASGSVVTDAVGTGELAVARGKQRNIPGYVEDRRAGEAPIIEGASE